MVAAKKGLVKGFEDVPLKDGVIGGMGVSWSYCISCLMEEGIESFHKTFKKEYL